MFVHIDPIRVVAWLCVASTSASAASPADILATFQVHPDFQIELMAMEPAVIDPVDMAFDEHGHPYLVEMPGYPFNDVPGRVVRLEDHDGDGLYETRVLFAENFPIADSILPYRKGFLVASPPDLVFIRDTDGDGTADEREVLMTGFAVGNTQHNYGGLNYGLDNWVYAANGGNSGTVRWTKGGGDPVALGFSDYRLDPERRLFELTGRSSGGFGATFDDWGRYYSTHNMEHLSQMVFPGRYLEHLPFARTGTMTNISDHEEMGTARIFPIGVQESRVNHPEQQGYFSGACGLSFYGGGAFPDGFSNSIFVCDVVLNLVHRDALSANGAAIKASRVDERFDFLASSDRSFRPVNSVTGPDGALYVLDMHRGAIEHPEWIPDEIEATLDLNAGKTEGRILRISPKDGLARKRDGLERKDTKALAAALSDANKWRRDMAQQLLLDERDKSAVPLLRKLLAESTNPKARLHALWTLNGFDALKPAEIISGLADPHEGVRENAVIIAEDRIAKGPSILKAVCGLAADPAPRVRLRAALALSTVLATMTNPEVHDAARDAAETIAMSDMADPWTRLAVFSALRNDAAAMVARMAGEAEVASRDGAKELVAGFARLAAEKADTPSLGSALAAVAAHGEDAPAFAAAALDGFAEGIEARDQPLSAADLAKILAPLQDHPVPIIASAAWRVASALELPPTDSQRARVAEAGRRAADTSLSIGERIDSLGLFSFADFKEREEPLFGLLGKDTPRAIQSAAMGQLGAVTESSVAKKLIGLWPTLGPETRKAASSILIYKRSNHDLLLGAMESGAIAIGQLNLDLERRRALLLSRDESIQRRAEALFSDAELVTRKEAMGAMRPALALKGDPAKGHSLFTEVCSKCHIVSGEGTDVGPNLTDVFRKSPESLMQDILDPNAALDTQFIAYAAETLDGTFVNGIIVGEDAETITLREALGKDTTFRRDDIQEMTSGGLSLMPEELEKDMDHRQMADLLAFLLQPR